MTSRLARLRPNRTDAALALALLTAGLVQVVVWPIAPRGVGELFVVGCTAPLAWRRTRPVGAALVSSAFWLIPVDGFPVLGFVVVILQFFSLGAWGSPGAAVWLAAAWASVSGVVGTLVGPEPPVAAIGAVLVVVAPTVCGRLVRHYRRQNADLAELAAQLRAERRRAEEAAVGAERARIAQELHDVVGHEVTLIAIQAEAAASALATAPERAVEPVEAIRSTAHDTLREIRAVLDLLAPEGDRGATDTLTALSRRAAAAGIPNSIAETGRPWPPHGPGSLAVSRIVRECLTNAGRHASGRHLAVTVAWEPEQVTVHAANPAAGDGPAPPGRGLTGIRHRAELLGGTFRAGVRDGCFELTVSLPAAVGDGAP